MTSHNHTHAHTALCVLYKCVALHRVAQNKGNNKMAVHEGRFNVPAPFFLFFCFVFLPTFPYRMASWLWQEELVAEMGRGAWKPYSHRPLSPSFSLGVFFLFFRSVSNGSTTAFDPIMSAFFYLSLITGLFYFVFFFSKQGFVLVQISQKTGPQSKKLPFFCFFRAYLSFCFDQFGIGLRG